MPWSRWGVVASVVGLLLGAGCGAASTPSAETRTPGSETSGAGASAAGPSSAETPGTGTPAATLRAEDVVTGLTTPWELIALEDGSLLTAERDTGRILRIVDGRV